VHAAAVFLGSYLLLDTLSLGAITEAQIVATTPPSARSPATSGQTPPAASTSTTTKAPVVAEKKKKAGTVTSAKKNVNTAKKTALDKLKTQPAPANEQKDAGKDAPKASKFLVVDGKFVGLTADALEPCKKSMDCFACYDG
jgi:hypothetical protein